MPEDEGEKNREGRSNVIIMFGMIPALLLGVALFLVLPNISTHFPWEGALPSCTDRDIDGCARHELG
mgnify:CR=1 FL=1